MAPGVLVAQAIGRWGNWFNQELFGRPTDLPWGLEIDAAHRPRGLPRRARPSTRRSSTSRLWCLAASALLIWADRRFRLGHGRVVALYVMVYTLGRGWIEKLRIDDVQLDDVLGLRLNVWTSIVLFVAAAVYFVVVGAAPPRPRGAASTSRRDRRRADDAEDATDEAPTDRRRARAATAGRPTAGTRQPPDRRW